MGAYAMILYKYCPPERIDILDQKLVGLTKPRFFNDPFELSSNISAIDDPIEMSRLTIEHTKNYVVLSLSELPDEPLVWGHYAVSLTGFVIGFDANQEILISHSAHRKVGKVTYTKARPTRPRLDDFTEDEIFFTKPDFWSYEREWRILDVQDAATSGPPSKTAYDTRMFTLNPAAVVEVICGWRGSGAREDI